VALAVAALKQHQAVAQEHRGKETKAAITAVLVEQVAAEPVLREQIILSQSQPTAALDSNGSMELIMLAAVAAQTTAPQERKAVLVGTAAAEMGIMALLLQLTEPRTLAAVVVAAVKLKPQEMVALA